MSTERPIRNLHEMYSKKILYCEISSDYSYIVAVILQSTFNGKTRSGVCHYLRHKETTREVMVP